MEAIAPSPKSIKNDADGNNSKILSLPEPVVHHIFSFLETIDVMRASGVSTDWRYLFTTMPHLNFKFESFRSPGELSFDRAYTIYKEFINWVLMAHDKSVSIRSCRLSCLNNDYDHSLYRWLRILAQKHVQKLYLAVVTETGETFNLPPCLLASDSLEVLQINLFRCDLNIPSYGGFSRLKSLILVRSHLLDHNLFRNFISRCPLLENLNLRKCMFHGFKVLEITSGSLKKFVIDCNGKGFPSYEDLTKFELKFACPNLVYFALRGPQLQNLHWKKYTSFLRTGIICPKWNDDVVPNEELANHSLKILGEFCHAENLQLHATILEYEGSGWKIPDEDITCLRCHLKTVELVEIDTANDEPEMISFFLKNGYVLEKMSIMWRKSTDRQTMRDALQKVTKFPRSSPFVTVSFSEL